jgi:hypothetical protein
VIEERGERDKGKTVKGIRPVPLSFNLRHSQKIIAVF